MRDVERSRHMTVASRRIGIVVLALCAAITGCKKKDFVAELTETQGTVEGERKGSWEPAKIGAGFIAGEAVRTAAASGARLKFSGGRFLRMNATSVVRFSVGPVPSASSVGIELGQADVEEGEGELFLATSLGRARLESGSRVRVLAAVEGTRFEVLVGSASFEDPKLGSLGAGQGFLVTLGSAKMEKYQVKVGLAQMEPIPTAPPPPALAPPPPTPSEPPPEPAPAPAKPAPTARKPAEAEVPDIDPDEGPRVADLVVPAGESSTIHDVHVPVLVRLLPSGACDQGELELSSARRRRKVSAQSGVVVPLQPGSHKYKIACGAGEPMAGSLVIRRDPGTAPVPRTAPANVIDADGRKYTVLYQNRLPAITFNWPKAPGGETYTLFVESGGKTRELQAKGSRHLLPSGGVSEGEHQFWFKAGDVTAPKTSLVVRFDNAAATAQLQSPKDNQRWGGAEIQVAGIAMEGSTVSVAGQAMTVDAQGRFRGAVAPPKNDVRSMAVRLAHPRSGVHYYIRRSGNR
jgi:hypothetical protein